MGRWRRRLGLRGPTPGRALDASAAKCANRRHLASVTPIRLNRPANGTTFGPIGRGHASPSASYSTYLSTISCTSGQDKPVAMPWSPTDPPRRIRPDRPTSDEYRACAMQPRHWRRWHFGGRQWYFMCPVRNRPASVLWKPSGDTILQPPNLGTTCRIRWPNPTTSSSHSAADVDCTARRA
jgi:hypothetical protein